MKKIVLLIALTASSLSLFAQSKAGLTDKPEIRPQNNIYINLLGDASIVSLNYDRLLFISQGFFFSGKVGVGYNEEFSICSSEGCSPEQFITVTHHVTGNLGKGRHFAEFGLGGTLINGNTNEKYLAYPIVGYRLQPLRSKKVNLRVYGSVPFTGLDTEDILYAPYGLSVGISF
ncbi:hypothetical protein ACFSRY_18830 [Pontibacter locisalis]|uniref:DUF3575 domain-containing protein n=1 Tax=Pontibacter locisalis TaxID=1719035 RepID=A0ABW5IRA5_9BACT